MTVPAGGSKVMEIKRFRWFSGFQFSVNLLGEEKPRVIFDWYPTAKSALLMVGWQATLNLLMDTAARSGSHLDEAWDILEADQIHVGNFRRVLSHKT